MVRCCSLRNHRLNTDAQCIFSMCPIFQNKIVQRASLTNFASLCTVTRVSEGDEKSQSPSSDILRVTSRLTLVDGRKGDDKAVKATSLSLVTSSSKCDQSVERLLLILVKSLGSKRPGVWGARGECWQKALEVRDFAEVRMLNFENNRSPPQSAK